MWVNYGVVGYCIKVYPQDQIAKIHLHFNTLQYSCPLPASPFFIKGSPVSGDGTKPVFPLGFSKGNPGLEASGGIPPLRNGVNTAKLQQLREATRQEEVEKVICWRNGVKSSENDIRT